MEKLDCKSLMIGDWVMINPISYYQVEQIRVEFGELRIYLKGTEVFATENEIMPVPLTPEILVKNGFFSLEDVDHSYRWQYAEGVFMHADFKSEEPAMHVVNGYSNATPLFCNYVHQWQHAMIVCGINMNVVI